MAAQFARAAIEIKTPRVLIRTGVPADDAAAYTAYATEPANFPHGGCEAGRLTRDKAAARLASFAASTAAGTHGWVLLFSRATGALMGYGGYNCIETVEGDGGKVLADVGIMLDHRFWGRGYGLEVLVGLVEWARREVRADVFRTETDPDNGAWRALMDRAGLGGCVARSTASYDAKKEVLRWRWDAAAWEEAKTALQAKGRWVEIE